MGGEPLVLRPEDPTARKGAMIFAALAAIGVIGLVIEIITDTVIGTVAAAIIAAAGVLLALIVTVGRSTLRVVLDDDTLHIAGKRVPRADIVGLRRRPVREGGLDIVGQDDTVLYAMPAWFDAEQEQLLAGALGVVIVEPEPDPETPEDSEAPLS